MDKERISGELPVEEEPIPFGDWRSQAVGVVWAPSAPGFIEAVPELLRDMSEAFVDGEMPFMFSCEREREERGQMSIESGIGLLSV